MSRASWDVFNDFKECTGMRSGDTDVNFSVLFEYCGGVRRLENSKCYFLVQRRSKECTATPHQLVGEKVFRNINLTQD